MTARVVNLSRARKAAAKDERRRQADANAAKFGRTKAERTAEEARAERARRDLDGHERER